MAVILHGRCIFPVNLPFHLSSDYENVVALEYTQICTSNGVIDVMTLAMF